MTYVAPSISGYNATPPSDDGAETTNNRIDWSKIKTKLTDPIRNYADSISSAVSSAFSGVILGRIEDKAVGFSVAASDSGKVFRCTAALTVTLAAATDLRHGFSFSIRNDSSGNVVIDPASSETINGSSTYTILAGTTCAVICNGSAFFTVFDGDVMARADNNFTGNNNFTGKMRFPDDGELTIATGAITVTGVKHTIDTEADAASDDLDTINGGSDGQVLFIRANNDARTVVLKHNTGNIYCTGLADITLDNYSDTIALDYSGALSKWVVRNATPAQGRKADSALQNNIIFVKDVKGSGSDGGTFTSDVWWTRELNTLTGSITGASLASGQVTLPAGTYKITGYAPAASVDGHQAQLYNVSDSSTAIYGSSALAHYTTATVTNSHIDGTITIAAPKVFEVRHRCRTTKSSDGFGKAASMGSEVYTTLVIQKLA